MKLTIRPGAHLALCHLCAPLLLLRSASHSSSDHGAAPTLILEPTAGDPMTPEISTAALRISTPFDPARYPPVDTVSISPPRIPYSTLLARATANHPKSRRLSGGGYLPPPRGDMGSELRGVDLCPVIEDTREPGRNDTTANPERPSERRPRPSGLQVKMGDEGRVVLASGEGGAERGRCLLCRAGVVGWLRVYT
jgi:hypothetical protein